MTSGLLSVVEAPGIAKVAHGPFDFASLHSGILGGLTLLNIAGDTKRPHKSLCGALESAYGNKTHIYCLLRNNLVDFHSDIFRSCCLICPLVVSCSCCNCCVNCFVRNSFLSVLCYNKAEYIEGSSI